MKRSQVWVRAAMAACLAGALLGATAARAAVINSWTVAGGGSWATGANWSSTAVPLPTEAATFTNIMPAATNTITLDGDQTIYALNSTTGSSGRIVAITSGTPTTSKLILLSSDQTSGSGAFIAINSTGGLNISAPIQLGDSTTTSATAVFSSTTNASSMTINGAITEAAGESWGVKLASPSAGIVNFGGAANANTYSGDTTIASGTLKINTDNQIPDGAGKGNLVLLASGIFSLNNTNETINGLSSTSTTSAVSKSGSNTKTLTIGNGDATASYAGTIAMTGGSSSITKIGLGTQTFSNTVGVVGAFTTNAGVTRMDGALTAPSATTAAAGTFGGTGSATLTGVFTMNGKLDPGDTTGTLDISTTNLALNNNSSLLVQLGGNTPADGAGFYDQVNETNAAGTVTLTGTVNLVASLDGAWTPSPSDVYYILTRADAAAFSTTFAGLPEGATVTVGSYTGQITYLANWTGTQAGSTLTGGNDVAIFNLVGTPEPASLALLSLGAMTMLRRRRPA